MQRILRQSMYQQVAYTKIVYYVEIVDKIFTAYPIFPFVLQLVRVVYILYPHGQVRIERNH